MRRRSSETKIADYTRRSLRPDVSGRGFDSRRLHLVTMKLFGLRRGAFLLYAQEAEV